MGSVDDEYSGRPAGFFYETWEHGGKDWHRVRVPAPECSRISAEFLEGSERHGEQLFPAGISLRVSRGREADVSRELVRGALQDAEVLGI